MTELYGRGVYRFLLSRQWVIVTLLFFYLTGLALIFGAEVNATINARRLHSAENVAAGNDTAG